MTRRTNVKRWRREGSIFYVANVFYVGRDKPRGVQFQYRSTSSDIAPVLDAWYRRTGMTVGTSFGTELQLWMCTGRMSVMVLPAVDMETIRLALDPLTPNTTGVSS